MKLITKYLLDQIPIRISDIDTADWTLGSSPLDHSSTFKDFNSIVFEPLYHLFQVCPFFNNEAEIGGAWTCDSRFWLEFLAVLVKINLMGTELERMTLH